jgi:hypothetical protein
METRGRLLGSWRMFWSRATMTSVSFIVCQSRVLHAMFVRGAFYGRTADVNTCSGLCSGNDIGRMDGWPKEAASSQSLSTSPKPPIPSDAQCRQKSFLGDVMGSFIIRTCRVWFTKAGVRVEVRSAGRGNVLQNSIHASHNVHEGGAFCKHKRDTPCRRRHEACCLVHA